MLENEKYINLLFIYKYFYIFIYFHKNVMYFYKKKTFK